MLPGDLGRAVADIVMVGIGRLFPNNRHCPRQQYYREYYRCHQHDKNPDFGSMHLLSRCWPSSAKLLISAVSIYVEIAFHCQDICARLVKFKRYSHETHMSNKKAFGVN